MKNWKDFFASLLAFIVSLCVLGTMYLVASPLIIVFLALFSIIWITSVALLAINRLCGIVRGRLLRKVKIQGTFVATTLSVRHD